THTHTHTHTHTPHTPRTANHHTTPYKHIPGIYVYALHTTEQHTHHIRSHPSFAHTCICAHTHIIALHTCIYARTHTHTHTHTHIIALHTCIYAHTHSKLNHKRARLTREMAFHGHLLK